MFKLYKETFKTTNDGIILATPLILFMWILTLYISYSRTVVDTRFEIILSVVTMLFMTSAFCSGWFYMVTKCVEFSKKDFIMDSDKATESMRLIQSMPDGVGKYFLTFILVSLMFVGIALSMVYIISLLGMPFVNTIISIVSQFGIDVSAPQNVEAILDKLSPAELMSLFKQLLIPSLKLITIVTIVPMIFSFLMMLWMPEIMYSGKDPFTALYNSAKKVFAKFKKSISLFIYLTIIQVLISFMGSISIINPVLYVLMMLLYFYFIVYVVILVFAYYDKEFNSQVTEESGQENNEQQTEDNSDSRSDS